MAGRGDIMAQFDRAKVGDDRFLPQIGTLSGNPVASVAGLATLGILKRQGTYAKVFATGRTLMQGLAKAVRDAGLPGQVIGEPVLFDVFFASGELADYRATLRVDGEMMRRFNRGLRENGVLKGDAKIYVSLAHDDRDVRQALDAFTAAANAAG